MKNGSYHCKERRVFCRIFIFVLKELFLFMQKYYEVDLKDLELSNHKLPTKINEISSNSL